jgi:hypothetical protein
MKGEVKFVERYEGDACERIVCPIVDDKVCSGHGTCDPAVGCDCDNLFDGPSCEIGNLPCTSCSGANSLCDGNSGECRCACSFIEELIDGRNVTSRVCYKGANCAFIECPKGVENPAESDPDKQIRTECSGHGQCTTSGACECEAKWNVYSNCEQERLECPLHPNGEPCGGMMYGNCRFTTGKCTCANNDARAYIGAACEVPTCPTSWENCNPGGALTGAGEPVRGKCMGDACVCNTGYGGKQCQSKDCALGTDGSQCNIDSAQGKCDPGSGICECFATAEGERKAGVVSFFAL